MSNIWVYMETGPAGLTKPSLEVLGEAKRQAAGGQVTALLLGKGLDEAAARAGRGGADKVLVADDDRFEPFNLEAQVHALVPALQASGADFLFMPVSTHGRELSSRLAMALDSGLAVDVTALENKDGALHFTRPIFAGKALETVTLEGAPAIATLRPNLFQAMDEDAGANAAVEPLSSDAPSDLRTAVKEAVAAALDKVPLQEAKVIVAGGRGMKGAGEFKILEDLAEVLGAAVAASRAAVDAGWREHSDQVGQTGKTVSPVLYIACGISGAIQHLAGMSSSRYIVAVNKDPEAPIFKVADYGIEGDLFEVVPMLTDEFKKVLA